MKKIVVLRNARFPEGGAAAIRLKTICKALTLLGVDVRVICLGNPKEEGEIDGIKYSSFRKYSKGFGRVVDRIMFYPKVKKYLEKEEDIFGIYIFGTDVRVFEYCKKIAKEKGIKLFCDCVEWYSPEEFRFGRLDYIFLNNNHINSKVIDNSFSVISISRYFESYFKSKNIKTIRLPIICDTQITPPEKMIKEDKLTLFYAGTPEKKDLIGNLLKATQMLSKEEQNKIRVIIIGVTEESLVKKSGIEPDVLLNAEHIVKIFGKVSREKVFEQMKEADFVVLPRDSSARYAQAGFPSKFVEALSRKTPMLCNISSDLGEYLVDGENAIIANDHTPEAFAEAIKRALKLTPEQKEQMCEKAFETAKKYFDYRLYLEKISDFFEV